MLNRSAKVAVNGGQDLRFCGRSKMTSRLLSRQGLQLARIGSTARYTTAAPAFCFPSKSSCCSASLQLPHQRRQRGWWCAAQLSTGVSGVGLKTAPAVQPSKQTSGYKVPPKEILDIVDMPAQPSLSFSPDRSKILQCERPPSYPPIFELARPELKLAGLRIDPEIFARSKMSYFTGLSIVPKGELVPSTNDHKITGYPEGSWINYVSWSPNGKQISFTIRSPGGPNDPPRQPLELWVADAETGVAKRLLKTPEYGLNAIFDDYVWLDDNTIIACVIPQNHGAPPTKPPIPLGPKIQDNATGKKSQNRTWTDLLKDAHDEDLLEYYGTSELWSVDTITGKVEKLAGPRLYTEIDVSPDSRYIMVSWLERPFSFNVPCGRFPARVELWKRDGTFVKELAYLPLAEDIPIAFNSCRKGPRGISWRSDKPAHLCWTECQDGGDPTVEVSPRDVVYMADADVLAEGGSASVLATTDLRCSGVSWGNDDLAILFESWYKTRKSVWWLIKPGQPGTEKELLFDRNYEDVYSDPGSPISRKTSMGTYVLATVNGERKLLMQGVGASPQGNKPFLDLLDLDTRESTRLWQSSPPYYETLGGLMSDHMDDAPIMLEGLSMLLSRETVHDPPQSYIKTFTNNGKDSTEEQVTNFPHPYPTLRDMQKEVIRYERNDGVTLTATLYLPPGYDKEKDGALPVILWAYPREFKSKEAAGQMRRSPHAFGGMGAMSPKLWLARGYAVLDGPTFPIIAEGDEEPNDTYVEQLSASAVAAVEELKRRGVADPARISVGGHSYGAFMAANLLIHCPDLFACGVARSGAYNRTLTPFGFQNEERTLWQTPETYNKMSPFMYADRIKKPILLMHGEDDNNTGTFPMQSERFYSALKGHGTVCRLVVLPHESHDYRSRESILHTLYEMDQWIERYAGYGRVDEGSSDSDSASS